MLTCVRRLSSQLGFLNISTPLDTSQTAEFQQHTQVPLAGASVAKEIDVDGATRLTIAYTAPDTGVREHIVIEPVEGEADHVLAQLEENILEAQELEAQWATRCAVLAVVCY